MPDPTLRPEPVPAPPAVPALPAGLRAQWPVVVAIAVCWVVAAVAAFTVPTLADWRPTCVAGLGVGVVGTAIFLWQRAAARRGARGAQVGFD